MEVHHHSHTPRKKWTHYFWEFVMLFLAITLGFFVENQREHYVEHKREKVFIKSFIEDLKQDTAKITQNINLRLEKISFLDSLMIVLNSPDPNQYGQSAYYFGRRLTRSTLFQSNDRTIKQLKNSGGLRLIRNQEASNAIMTYDQLIDYIYYLQNTREVHELTVIYPFLAKLYDGRVLETMIDGMSIVRPPGNPALRTTDKNLISDLTYYIHQYKSTSVVIVARLRTLQKSATEALQFLQNEYHLD